MICTLTLNRPWLTLDFHAPLRVLSWAINTPGFTMTPRIVWREVRNADLPRDLDVHRWLDCELAAKEYQDAVALLTSRDLRAYHDVTVTVEDVTVRCVATVGLSNAERVGTRMDRSSKDWGTINLAVVIETGLTDGARLEALSIAAQARTLAVLQANQMLSDGHATGTGTDCIAIAAPAGPCQYAGLHTALGEAIGQAVLRAVSAGAQEWMDTIRREEDI